MIIFSDVCERMIERDEEYVCCCPDGKGWPVGNKEVKHFGRSKPRSGGSSGHVQGAQGLTGPQMASHQQSAQGPDPRDRLLNPSHPETPPLGPHSQQKISPRRTPQPGYNTADSGSQCQFDNAHKSIINMFVEIRKQQMMQGNRKGQPWLRLHHEI